MSNNQPIHKHHEKALHTAKHYGFIPFGGLTIDKQDISKIKNFKDSKKNSFIDKDSAFNFDSLLEEKICLMRMFLDKKMNDLSQPPMICYSGPIVGNPHADKYHRTHERTFNMEIIGNGKSIADAIIIETAYVILKEHLENPDEEELVVEINSIGDKDSFSKFTKDFVAFCKKHQNSLPASMKAEFKKDPFMLFSCKEDACNILQEEAPKPMSYLSEQSRDHFREVLEYVESLNIPYTINHSLIGSKHYSSGTIFQIVKISNTKKGEKREVIGIGERYNSVSKKAWGKKEVPAIGATLLVDEKVASKSKPAGKNKKEVQAKFYFIQLGYDAKLKSLSVIEMLRVANIPVHQSLSRDKITSQLAAAEKMAVPYILILGQKEAIEESVTVRHMITRVQETVPIIELVQYLKKLD